VNGIWSFDSQVILFGPVDLSVRACQCLYLCVSETLYLFG